ncbi:hypothetical protein J6590_105344 [Homalodisca vitripennis]|nr:hypothetical protein J6590_105344 [Homalodisca vitripennis]
MAGACRARKVVSKLDSPTCQNIFRDQVDKRLCKSKACRCENALVARTAPTPVVGSGTSQKAESPKSGLNFSRLNPSDRRGRGETLSRNFHYRGQSLSEAILDTDFAI